MSRPAAIADADPQADDLDASRAHGIGRLLLLARRDFLARLAGRLPDGGGITMTRSCGALLPYIDVAGTRSTVLARRTGISKQAIARSIRQLEDEGILQRKPDGDDGRAYLITFTRRGLAYLRRMHVAIGAIEADYARLVGADRMAVLRAALERIAYPAPPASPGRPTRAARPTQAAQAEPAARAGPAVARDPARRPTPRRGAARTAETR